ncbi:DNA damage-inducible protein D [Planctomycetales bacterium]|nr:DNA damage-inducible protein D [Planctomycetales bacterium]GHT38213.1 DNA damage-inducible protein D [Planctomycetales bacterium]
MNNLRKIDDLIDPQDGFVTFEQLHHENGNTYWLASELMQRLGYGDNMKSFYKAINRANKAMTGLNIDPFSNISKITGAEGKDDYKLTRFASYLVVMNADPKKPEVATAQAYFVAMTRQFELWLEDPEDVTRVAFRQEIKEQNKRLSGAAENAGVSDYAYFQNAGYLGMYNMMNVQLAERRRLGKNELLEYMGTAEMAANLFRIEMTKAKLELSGNVGQSKAEAIHKGIGREVRDMVKRSTGKNPEDLPVERLLPDIEKQLKLGHKEMKKMM